MLTESDVREVACGRLTKIRKFIEIYKMAYFI